MTKNCICCDSAMVVGLQDWHKVCSACDYEKATLNPTINQTKHSQELDEEARALALIGIRHLNFKKLVEQILRYIPAGSKLLDVGCAHGWFLQTARHQLKVEGIEPDKAIYQGAEKLGLSLRCGYFPEILNPSDTYDAITFNDVIEHISDVQATLQAVKNHLNPNGILLLNVPNRNGVFYRVAKLFCLLGVSTFFERLWQVGLPSPHLHYFNRQTLTKLLVRSGFKVQAFGRLETIVLSGLFKRISYVGNNHWIINALLYLTVATTLPILKLLPSDILYVIATPERH